MSREWVTPEEVDARRERNRKLMYIGLPLSAAVFGAGITYLMNMM